MPDGFWYAGGPIWREESIPASAYSRGDILQLNSSSSFSRTPATTWPTSGAVIFGVADGSSLQSISNKCTALVPGPTTLFWASCNTALGSHLTPGGQYDVAFAVANSRYYVTSSANTPRVVVVRGTAEVSQSVQSRVLVRFLTSGSATGLV